MQVLIVDDSKIALISLKALLTENGYEVFTANNGKEGLEVLEQHASCRAIISDWEMPEMNGIEFCRAVRNQDTNGVHRLSPSHVHSQVDELV